MNAETKSCQNCKNDFTIEPDDFVFYEKINVPAPIFCPDCRFQNRMMFRNDRTFYRRACDLCQSSIISTYAADAPHPVYCNKCWWSDNWNPLDYGRDFDFSRPFFEQFKELLDSVPALAIMNDNGISSVNCEYTYDWFYSKNCYMNVAGWHAENVLYSYHIEHNKDVMDSMHMRECELVYECIQCYKLGRCAYCTYCSDCQGCFLSYDLKGCSDCVMCIGLRNKKYCIKNVQYSKEDYEQKVKELGIDTYASIEKLKKEFEAFALGFPRNYAHILKSVNSTGDFVLNSKNAQHSFMVINGENLKYIFGSDTAKDTYDCEMTGKSELCNDCMVADEANRNSYTVFCMRSTDLAYSQYCPGAEYCFGSVGLKKGSYSIFNKQYSKEEYTELREKIIEHMKTTGEWGMFFPAFVSPYAYNESPAQELFPLTKEEAEAAGYRWKVPAPKNYAVTVLPEDVPDTITQTPDAITEEIIGCVHEGMCNHTCTTAFKVTSDELNLYKKLNLPIPHMCPNCRHYDRLARRRPIKLWHRSCICNNDKHEHSEKCANEFETSYAPDRPEVVYCEKCYQQEVA